MMGESAWGVLMTAQQQFQAFEQHGTNFLNNLTAAIREESWRQRLLALSWTAGPVTYLALLAGFRLGYGKRMPQELFIYFAAYTVVAGVISLVAGVVKRATITAKRQAMEKILAEVIVKIPDLIDSIRNLRLQNLPEKERRVQGAIFLLSDPDATEASIETALEDLTESRKVARGFRRLEAYRKKGLWTLVNVEAASIRKKHGAILAAIGREFPHAGHLLENRLAGRIPSKRIGRRRRYGFMYRIIAATDTDDPESLELADAEELLRFILELLLDRRFTVIRWKLRGEHTLVSASRASEKINLKVHKQRRRIRLEKYAVLELLDRIINQEAPPSEQAESQLYWKKAGWERTRFTMAAMPDFTRPEAIVPSRGPCRRDLKERLDRIRRHAVELERQVTQKKEADVRFNRNRHQLRRRFPSCLETEDASSISVQFEHDTFRFRPEDKIRFARHLHGHLAHLTTNRERTRVMAMASDEDSHEEPRLIGVAELKAIVFRLFAQLERLLDLSEEAVIDSLEAASAINTGAIEYHLSRRTKIGWLQALVEDLEETDDYVAFRTAERLVSHIRCRLPGGVARDLAAEYQLPLEKLLYLEPSHEDETETTDISSSGASEGTITDQPEREH